MSEKMLIAFQVLTISKLRTYKAHTSNFDMYVLISPPKPKLKTTIRVIVLYYQPSRNRNRKVVISEYSQKILLNKTICAGNRWHLYCTCKSSQQMADRPNVRLRPYEPPFTFAGVDYFSPRDVEEKLLETLAS